MVTAMTDDRTKMAQRSIRRLNSPVQTQKSKKKRKKISVDSLPTLAAQEGDLGSGNQQGWLLRLSFSRTQRLSRAWRRIDA